MPADHEEADPSMLKSQAAEPDAAEPAIVLSGVQKRYGHQVAVRELSLSIPRGELFAFVGPNGAGKTTTIKLIAGLLRPDAGTVHVCGHPVQGDGLAAKARLAYVPDQPFLYEKLTGREFLQFVAQMYGLSPAQRDAGLARLIPQLGLAEFVDRLTDGFSHGMKQRLVLAAALLHEPLVLVIDEPMVGLDPRTVRTVKDMFRAHVRAGGTIFMSTHTLEVAEAMADRIGIIHRGELLAVGTLEQLRAQSRRAGSALEDIFLSVTEAEHAGDGT